MTINVGIVGTSWWADAMYLPALREHPQGRFTAICGRNPENNKAVAERWNIPHTFTDYNAMIDSGTIDAIIISTPNDTHYPITMKALEQGLHILCEKPIGLNYSEAKRMAEAAEAKGIKHLVPYTYRFMPTGRYLKELIDGGFIGKPYHLNMRYYTGYGRGNDYVWRFDVSKSGAGAVGDIGSHFLYLASWYYGKITGLYCHLGWFTERPQPNPEGKIYEPTDDTAIITLQFENGAQGVIHTTTQGYEDSPFGQKHFFEFHGSDGTLHCVVDWDKTQQITGAKAGKSMHEITLPDYIWNGARHDTVHNTYRDVFRKQDVMTRQWVTAIANHQPVSPTLQDGAYIQRLIDAALKSHKEKRWVEIEEIQ